MGSPESIDIVADDAFEKIPPKEGAEMLKRTLEGLYGRQDLQELSEGRTIIPAEYDRDGRYIGPAKQETREEELPF